MRVSGLAGPISTRRKEAYARANFPALRRRSAYVPDGKAESVRALPRRIHCGLGHRRKRSQEFSGINCVAATI